MKTKTLTAKQYEALGKELDAIRADVLADLGQRDTDYIQGIIKLQRRLEVAGRGLLMVGFLPPAWLAGVAALGSAKILDNMEIGHNIMHGQFDWTRDPKLSSQNFEWDTACPADQWRHSHNYMHHTFTNVQGVDRDIGYGVLRMSEEQKWHPYFLLNGLWATLLAAFFQYGVALHDLEVERVRRGKHDPKRTKKIALGIWNKVRRQTLKDYILFPALAGPMFPFVFAGNAAANLTRNFWSFMIIFCGHFPEEVEQFPKEMIENESRGQWYFRQLLGSANLEGGKWFHIFSGNLSHQIEHHLFPDLPAHRYAELSPKVQAICERFDLPYNSGPLSRQFGSVVKRIMKLSLPGRSRNMEALAA